MENGGGSTTLASGIPSTVSSKGSIEAPKAPSNVVAFERKGNSAKPVEKEAPKLEKQEPAEIIEFAPRKRTNADVADELFESAKTDGVDKALERFAKDEFDAASKEDKPSIEGETLSEEQIKIEKEQIEGDKKELLPVDVRIANLEARVGELASENKALEKRLAETTELAKSGMLTALELAKILREMIEMEEDEKKKKKAESLLLMLTGLIAKMMALIMVPEEHEEDALERIDEAGKAA